VIRSFHFQLTTILRRRVVAITALATLVFSVGAAALVLASASNGPVDPEGRRATLAALSRAGGGTEIFARGIAFTGTFLFVLFVGAFAVDFSRGTVRTMLLRQPGRTELLVGKVGGLLAYAAVWLGVAEVLTWIAAHLFAGGQHVSTSQWTSASALASAIGDYATALAWITGYAVLALMVAVLTRSVPIALGVGIAWSGPFEHLVQNAWPAAVKVFPGLLLEAFVAGGTTEISGSRALITAGAYAALAAAIAMVAFTRRDVTA
jgi:ABC-2 type transport system permease protein